MAGQINISGATDAVQLHGNDDYTVARDFTFPDESGELLIKTANDDVPGIGSINGGQLAGLRNQIINGNFTIQQRGNSFSAPADEYTFDRWWVGNAAGRNVGITSDGPYQNALLITNNASDNVFLRQGIEIQQGKCGPFIQNSIWTLSLWSDTPAWVGRRLGVAAFRDAKKMDDSTGEVPVGSAGTFTATGETAAGMARYSLQIDIGTTQPAATNEMLCVGLSLPTGGHRISGVQLEPGPVATPFEHRPIGLELSLCQRYYQQTSISFRGFITATGTATKHVRSQRPVTMRVDPVETGTATAGATAVMSGTTDMVSITLNNTANDTAATVSDYTADAEL